jgi:N-methylhydantoinase B
MKSARTEIMRNRFAAIAEEAATLAYRTAHTTFVKQTQDFQVALARPSGEFFAFPTMTGVTSAVCQSVDGMIEPFRGDLAPGDVIISNDPHRTRGLVTHTMDIHLAQPIFFDGDLVAIAWAFVHASDIGGAVPGSISPDLYEVYQEGIQLRPLKLRRAGTLNRDIVDILQDNSRIGAEIWGDLEAMQSAMRLLDRRVNALCRKIGRDAFVESVDAVMDYAEAKARAVIGRLSDGTWHFSDYLEGDSPDDAVHIRCRLTVRGDEAEIDYSGSDPQVHAALNFATGGRSHPFLCLALTNYINTVEPSTPVNGGIIRPILAYAPPGTLMNAAFPAAMGNRWVAVMRTYDALMGCLNQAVPGGLAACGAGQAGIISVAWPDRATGRTRVAVVEPFSGGSGARVTMDGVDANDTMVGYLKSTPIETVEIDTPLIVREHALVADRFGHGRYRGGAAVAIELESRSDEATLTVRGLDRFRFQPWGIGGGTPGGCCETWRNPHKAPESLGRIRVVTLGRGDRLRMVSSSGGGFGRPVDRPAGQVCEDVANGLLSEETARSVYRVVLDAGAVDAEATAKAREGQPNARPGDETAVSHGSARIAYEATLPEISSSIAANAVLAAPAGMRRFLHAELKRDLREGRLSNDPLAVAEAVRVRIEPR